MGCCASNATTAVDTTATNPSNCERNKNSVTMPSISSPTAATVPNAVGSHDKTSSGIPSTPAPVETNSTPLNPTPVAAPAPDVKHVRAAYSGKGWAPPQKEWESNQKQNGTKTRIEIEDEWDDDGNLKRKITKHVTTPDWKKKTEQTIEIIPASEAEKMGLGRK